MAGSNAGNSDTMGLEVVLQSNPFASAANEDEKAEQFPKLGYEKVTATNQDGAEVKEAVAIAIGSPMFVDGTSEANRQVSELGMRVRESGHEVYSEIMEGVAAPMKPPMAKVTWHDASDEENDEEEEEEVDGEEDYSGSDDDYSEEHVVDGDEMQGGGLHREEDVELEWDKEERQEGREEKEKEKEDMEYPALTATRTRREVEDEDRAIKGGGQRARVKMPPEAMAVSLVSVREPEEGASMVSGEYPKLAISEKEWKYDDEYVPERDGRKKRKEGKKKRQIEQDDLRSCASYPSISVSEKGWQDGDDDEYHPGPRASRRGSGDEEEVMVESSDEAEVEFEAEVDEEEVYEYEEGSEEDEDGGHGGEEGVEYEEVEEIEDDEEMGYDGSDAEVEYVEVLEDDEHLALRNGDQGGQESDRAKSRGLTVQMETAMELHKTTDKDSLNPRVLHSDELDEIQEEGEEEEEDGDGDGDADLEDVHIGGGLMPRAAASADQEGVEGRDPAPWEVAGLYQRATSLEHQQLAEVRAALLESQAQAIGLEAALAQARMQAAAQDAVTIQLSEQLHAMRRFLISSEERARLAEGALRSKVRVEGKGPEEKGDVRLEPGSHELQTGTQAGGYSILEEQVCQQADELHRLRLCLARVQERAHVAESALAGAGQVVPGSILGSTTSQPLPNTLELVKVGPESNGALFSIPDGRSSLAANVKQEVAGLREELAVQANVAREQASAAATAQQELGQAKRALEAVRLLLLSQEDEREKLESQLRDTQGQVAEPGRSLSFGGAGAGPVPNGDAGQGGPEKPSRKGVMRSTVSSRGKGVGKQGDEEGELESLKRELQSVRGLLGEVQRQVSGEGWERESGGRGGEGVGGPGFRGSRGGERRSVVGRVEDALRLLLQQLHSLKEESKAAKQKASTLESELASFKLASQDALELAKLAKEVEGLRREAKIAAEAREVVEAKCRELQRGAAREAALRAALAKAETEAGRTPMLAAGAHAGSPDMAGFRRPGDLAVALDSPRGVIREPLGPVKARVQALETKAGRARVVNEEWEARERVTRAAGAVAHKLTAHQHLEDKMHQGQGTEEGQLFAAVAQSEGISETAYDNSSPHSSVGMAGVKTEISVEGSLSQESTRAFGEDPKEMAKGEAVGQSSFELSLLPAIPPLASGSPSGERSDTGGNRGSSESRGRVHVSQKDTAMEDTASSVGERDTFRDRQLWGRLAMLQADLVKAKARASLLSMGLKKAQDWSVSLTNEKEEKPFLPVTRPVYSKQWSPADLSGGAAIRKKVQSQQRGEGYRARALSLGGV